MMKFKLAALKVEKKVREFFSEERGDVNVVSIVVLIGVAVMLAILFRDSIEDLLDTLFGTIENTSMNVIS